MTNGLPWPGGQPALTTPNTNHHLEQMAQALFKSWFIDFEPFLDGDFIYSELGEIPVGWQVVPLNDVATFTSGYSYKSAELQESTTAMVTIKNFQRKGGFKSEGFKEIAISGKTKPAQFLNKFDIIVAHTDLTQNADVVGNAELLMSDGGYEKLIISLDLVKVEEKTDFPHFLLAALLKSPQFKSHALGFVNGTTVLHLSKKALPEYRVALPEDLSAVANVSSALEAMYRQIARNNGENERLAKLRDSLLPRLMSGELSVAGLSG